MMIGANLTTAHRAAVGWVCSSVHGRRASLLTAGHGAGVQQNVYASAGNSRRTFVQLFVISLVAENHPSPGSPRSDGDTRRPGTTAMLLRMISGGREAYQFLTLVKNAAGGLWTAAQGHQ
jgi:hypothetical protein